MKIITGTARGRFLKTPKNSKIIRPALGQVREAIFSSLGSVEDLVIMDVFAGTGSLGLEGLSRGAKQAYFVDSHPEAVKLIIENLRMLGFEDRGHVFKRRIPHGLKTISLEHKPDILFCDPPYDKGLLAPALEALVRYKFVDPQTLVIVEHTKRELPQTDLLELTKQKQYGQTIISTLRLRSVP